MLASLAGEHWGTWLAGVITGVFATLGIQGWLWDRRNRGLR